MFSNPPVALFPLCLVALSKLLYKHESAKALPSVLWWMGCFGIPTLWLWALGQSTAVGTVVLWRILTTLACGWPTLVSNQEWTSKSQTRRSTDSTLDGIMRFLVQGGPLGTGCGKVVEVAVACLLWYSFRGSLPERVTETMNPTKSIKTLPWLTLGLGMAVASTLVNAVLFLWSRHSQSNGSHSGLNSYLQPTLSRDLTLLEHGKLVLLATANAVCEEFTSRGFWRRELELSAGLSRQASNVGQAIIFGAWHYYGIPSGWTGVALTTVYGWIMGALSDYTRPLGLGLVIPIVLHTVADYYIFAVLARKKNVS